MDEFSHLVIKDNHLLFRALIALVKYYSAHFKQLAYSFRSKDHLYDTKGFHLSAQNKHIDSRVIYLLCIFQMVHTFINSTFERKSRFFF